MTDVKPTTPTLEEVAAVAGVSRATVSRVVNGNDNVSESARQAVQLAIETLGYVPNRAARSLVTRRNDSVALVVAEPETRLFSDPFFAGVVRGVSQELAQRNLQLVLLMEQGARGHDRLERYLLNGHVDGAMLLSLHGDDPLPQRLRERGMPVVVCGRPPLGVDVSSVDADNVDGARQATAYLLGRGRTNVATIAGPLDMPAAIDRLHGYREALAAAGVPVDADLEEPGDFTDVGGARALRALLSRRPTIDAVFAASDLMAAGALGVLADIGRRVPDDVAVVGFDDSVAARTAQPPLSTIRQPVEQMGQELARLLLRMLESAQSGSQRIVLPTELVLRASA